MELLVDAPRCLRGNARNALELLRGGGDHLVDGAEVLEQRATPRGTDTLEVVEDRSEAARLATLAVEAEREPVCLVADALQQLKPGVVPREHDRVAAAGDEDLLDPLGERD